MEKDKKILLSLILVILVFAGILSSFAYHGLRLEDQSMNDSKKFKEEYEFYNGKMNESNQMNYPVVEISSDNPVEYLSDDEASTFLTDQTGLIYFGYSSCPWCRSMVPVLLSAAKSTNLGKIYYVDIQNIRDQITLDDQNHLIVTDEGTNGYHEILKQLDDVLDPFLLTGKNGEKIDTSEKRLYAPTVVTVKNGEILDIHVSTVETQQSGYSTLTEEEQKTLFDVYEKMILSLLSSTCDEAC